MNLINSPYLVQHFLEHSAERLPAKVALICGQERLTYSEINEKAERMAANLINMGIKRQDRVAIFLDNSVESVIAIFGILKTGAVFIMLSATIKPQKLSNILKDSGARVLITHQKKKRLVKEAFRDAGDLKHIVWCGSENVLYQPVRQSTHSWSNIISRPPSFPASKPQAFKIDLDLAAIIYTSGSTGTPKGVMCAHFNVVSATRSIITYLKSDESDIVLCALPLSFGYGLYQILMTFASGGTVVLEQSFVFPYRVLEKVAAERVTGLPLVPTMAALMLKMDLSKFGWRSLRYITNAAAALPVAHILKLKKFFTGVNIFSMYGLTECTRVSYLPPEDLDSMPDSVGIPMPNEEVYVVNEKGEEVGAGDIGELVVRGSNVMQGYWNSPEETDTRFHRNPLYGFGTLYTGDLFKKDQNGYLYFVARKDDLIKTKGERVSPKEIENVLCNMENVAEAAVIGIPDEIFGQAIKAFIVARNGLELNEKQIIRYCDQNLEPFMIPKHVEFRESFPKLSNGKIDKKKLG